VPKPVTVESLAKLALKYLETADRWQRTRNAADLRQCKALESALRGKATAALDDSKNATDPEDDALED
jgi:hypothetical protein